MIEAVVLDLGGVLVRLGDFRELTGDRDMTEREFWTEWLKCEPAAAFERGEMAANEFAEAYVTETKNGLSGAEFLDAFLAWPKGLYPGTADLVASIDKDLPLYCLSNTNALHWMGQTDSEQVQGFFDKAYLSFEIGLVKPDVAIFEHLVAELDREPSSILFIDDNQINVDSAASIGITARKAKGPVEFAAALSDVTGH